MLLLVFVCAAAAFELYTPATNFHEEACEILDNYTSPPAGGVKTFHDSVSKELQLHFTMDGALPWETFIVDDSDEGRGTHYKFSRSDIDFLIEKAKRLSEGSC
jgi:hypothetical protein